MCRCDPFKSKVISRMVLILLVISSFGCGASRTVINKAQESVTIKYQIIEIPNFKKTNLEWVPYDSYTEIPDLVAERLRDTNRFKRITRNESDGLSDSDVLIVKGTVTGFDRGCKFCEWFSLGINDNGKGTVYVWVKLIDKKTGRTITDASINGRASDPGYGRSRYLRVSEEIVELIENISDGKIEAM